MANQKCFCLSWSTVVKHQTGAWEALEHHERVDDHVSNIYGGGYQPMVQLVGGSYQDPLGNWRMKKLKLAPKKLDSAEV